MLIFSFNVAIKSSRKYENLCDGRLDYRIQKISEKNNRETYGNHLLGLLDEAKTMATFGDYHENIVNLQGITIEGEIASLRKVNFETKFYFNRM